MCDKLSKQVLENVMERSIRYQLCWKNRKKALDKGEYVYAIFMDLPNVFDTINLSLAKLKSYGFSENTLKVDVQLLQRSATNSPNNNNFSLYKRVRASVLKKSIHGPLLFNLFINELVLFLCEIF